MAEGSGFDIDRVLEELGDASEWDMPQGYPTSLALCVMDSIWSLGVRYRAVENVLHRYLKARGYQGLGDAQSCQDGPGAFLDWYRLVGGLESPERAAEALSNWNLTSSVNGVLKVAAVAQACELLVEMGVATPADLRARAASIEPRWRTEIPGQRSGISWRYALMLAGEPGVKPDRVVDRFMRRMNAPQGMSADQFVSRILDALGDESVTATMVDHRIWMVERNSFGDQLEDLGTAVAEFAVARDWDQFHSIKNLLLALIGEVGELAELVQWKSDEELEQLLATEAGRARFGEEVADVFVYLLRIAQKAHIDLAEVVEAKITMNGLKYPVSKSKGNAVKYNER